MKNIKTIKNLYEEKFFNLLPFFEEYWTDNRNKIKKIIRNNNCSKIAEIGCGRGFTTEVIARSIPENGFVLAVDPFIVFNDGISFHSDDEQPNFDRCFVQFLSNMVHANVANKIFMLREKSVDAALRVENQSLDMVYIDGAHDEVSVYNDLRSWFPKIKYGGIITGDDWCIESVASSVKRFIGEYNLILHTEEQLFWYFNKV